MLSSPAASRNKEPILQVLKKYLYPAAVTAGDTSQLKCLEIASGTGEHIVYFAKKLPNVVFQPSEINPRCVHSIVAYVDDCKLPNLRVPLIVDARKPPDIWSLPLDFGPSQLDALLCVNMIHISNQEAIDGLFSAAGGLLRKQGKLITYGPYAFSGLISPQSNVDFDAGLRRENSDWGLRDVEDLKKLAEHNGLTLVDIHDMPANNHMLVFIRK